MAKNNTRPNYARSQVRCGQDVNNGCKLIVDWLKLAKLYKLVTEWLCANIRSRHVRDSIYICFADTKMIKNTFAACVKRPNAFHAKYLCLNNSVSTRVK